MYYCYILYSPSKDLFYKGQTSDLQLRIDRHNAQQEKATKHGAPWVMLWATPKNSRSDATILERKLKNLSRERLCQLMLKYHSDIRGPDELLLIQQLSGC